VLSGIIIESFIGKWTTDDRDDLPVLLRSPPELELDDGELMCIVKLRIPVSLFKYVTVHKKQIRPLIKSSDETRSVVMVIIPFHMLCTLPNGM
jgi:hypothetical protein